MPCGSALKSAARSTTPSSRRGGRANTGEVPTPVSGTRYWHSREGGRRGSNLGDAQRLGGAALPSPSTSPTSGRQLRASSVPGGTLSSPRRTHLIPVGTLRLCKYGKGGTETTDQARGLAAKWGRSWASVQSVPGSAQHGSASTAASVSHLGNQRPFNPPTNANRTVNISE